MKFVIKGAVLTGACAAVMAASGTAVADGHCNTPTALPAMSDLSGEVITVAGPWEGRDEELVNMVFDCFEAATGADVQYSGSGEFEQLIVTSIRSGNAPNVAVFPQPGLAADMAAEGGLDALGDELAAWMTDNYGAGSSWVDLGTYADENGDDHFYGFAYKVDVKSLVWYSPEAFDDNGYDIPESMEALVELSDQMVADGLTPWCIGIESGGATGWTATDWMEDIMLRTASPETYDAWVSNELPFNSPEVINAMEVYGSISRNDDYVAGGADAVASIFFGDSPKGLFTTPAQCMMHRQASFIPSFFPNQGQELADGEADFFYFPAFAEGDLGKPVLGAGTLWAAPDLTDATKELFNYLTTASSHEIWMAQSGFLTPHLGVDSSAYANDALRGQGEILANATTFRFDASDLMPGPIGAGAFWTEMTAFANGQDSQTTADNIQAAWDAIK